MYRNLALIRSPAPTKLSVLQSVHKNIANQRFPFRRFGPRSMRLSVFLIEIPVELNDGIDIMRGDPAFSRHVSPENSPNSTFSNHRNSFHRSVT